MHMADALLSPAVGGGMYAVSTVTIAYSVHKIKSDELGQQKLPLMAVSGAFVFAAQMINFTIPGTGSSGHIGGGILLAGLLGGAPSLITLAAVLVIQCLFFADGGLLALGANIFNMGVIPCLIVYPLLFRPLLKKGITRKRLTFATILSAIVSLQLGAFSVVLETMASGVTELPFGTFVALMQPIHLAIGTVEGIITAAVLNFVYQMRPELLTETAGNKEKEQGKEHEKSISVKKVVTILAILTLLVGGGLSLYASANPDGLEWSVAKTAGTEELEKKGKVYDATSSIQKRLAFLPDYDFEDGEGKGTSFSGVAGAVLTCLVVGAAGWSISVVKRRKSVNEKSKSESV